MRLLPALLCVACLSTACTSRDGEPPLEDLAGTFGQGLPESDTVVVFQARDGVLLMQPALWSGPMVLRRVTSDSFVVAEHPRFGVAFQRDGVARVYGLSSDTRFLPLTGEPRAIQLLMDGEPAAAARRYMMQDKDAADRYVAVGREFYRSSPTRVDEVVAYFQELSLLAPARPEVHYALAGALVAARRRTEAESAYRTTLLLDPAHRGARQALVRMGAEPAGSGGGWQLPFELDSLFLGPSQNEIQAVIADWATRDLDPVDPEVVLRRAVEIDGSPAELRVLAHRVAGQRHLGVVIVPEGAAGLPVLLEAKGVSPNFFPMFAPDGLTSPFLMAEARASVIYAAPGYRGERIVVGADTLQSEGDPRNAWDGATDDLIAFLRVAITMTPEADASRVCVFGRSRGGTVALLAGIREPSIDCVVSWAAPTDWFQLMGLDGWSQKELVADGLRNRATPNQPGGQVINVFLADAIDGTQDLRQTRARIISGSPLYFADRLGKTQAHWGLEDSIVPSVNGQAFVDAYSSSGRPSSCLEYHFYPVAGHDQDRHRAPILSRQFILDAFSMGESECR